MFGPHPDLRSLLVGVLFPFGQRPATRGLAVDPVAVALPVTWGKYDGGPPYRWLLNTAPQMSMDEQQQIAKVYISAFAETVLHGSKEYFRVFKNSAFIADWLPKKIVMNTYKDSDTQTLINYEEDIDLTTGGPMVSKTKGADLRIWRETELRYRDNDTQSNNAVIIGWKRDSTKVNPAYSITFNSNLNIDSISALQISMSRGDIAELKLDKGEETKSDQSLNFSIHLIDSAGNMATAEIHDIKKFTPQLKIQFVKIKGLNQANYGNEWEPTLEFFEIPIAIFKGGHLNGLKEIVFTFDKSENGVVILDEIGLNH